MDEMAKCTIDILEDAIKVYNKKKDLTPSDLEALCKAYHLKMDIEDVYGMDEEGSEEENGMSRRGMNRSYGMRYMDGNYMDNRYMDGRYMDGHYMNGRYMDGPYMDGRYIVDYYKDPHQNWNHYDGMRSPVTGKYISRDGNGMSSHSLKDRMIARLEEMYNEAVNEYEREEIRKEIKKIEDDK